MGNLLSNSFKRKSDQKKQQITQLMENEQDSKEQTKGNSVNLLSESESLKNSDKEKRVIEEEQTPSSTEQQDEDILQPIQTVGLKQCGQAQEILRAVCIKDEEYIKIGQMLKINGINEQTTMEYVALWTLQEYNEVVSMMRLSFVAEFGEAMLFDVNKKAISGRGKDNSVEAVTGFLTSALTFCVIDYIRAGFIRVRQNNRVKCDIQIYFSESVLDLKKKILMQMNIPIDEQRLRFDNKALINEQSLNSYGIQEGVEIQLIQSRDIEIQISIESEALFNLKVENSTKISYLKNMITKQRNIQSKVLLLYFSGKILEDNMTIKEYNIQEEMIVQVKVKPVGWMEISVQVEGLKIELQVINTDTIESVKKKIKEQKGIQIEQQWLAFEDHKLEDIQTLKQCRIKNGDVLSLTILSVGIMWIQVNIPGNKMIVLNVQNSDAVMSIKQRIHMKFEYPIEVQRLTYNGVQLKDEQTLLECGINNMSTLLLIHQTIFGQISIVMPDGHTINIKVGSTDMIKNVKKKIQKVTQISSQFQILTFEGNELKDGKNLKDYNINFNQNLILTLKNQEQIQIFVRTQSGKTITLNISSLSSIRDLKKMFLQHEKTPVDQYRMIFAGKQLDDKRLLNDYGIQNLSTVDVQFLLRGGGDPIEFLNISQRKFILVDLSLNAPIWMTPMPGLNLGAICQNEKCEAFGKQVISNMHYTDFDFNVNKAYCPMCKEAVDSKFPVYQQCLHREHFKKANNEVTVTQWNEEGQECKTYEPQVSKDSNSSMAKYERLVIHVRPNGESVRRTRNIKGRNITVPIGVTCGLCHQRQRENENNIVVMQCGHNFHKLCAQAWKDRGLNCPHCEEQIAEIQ